jgi:hypothetical protein
MWKQIIQRTRIHCSVDDGRFMNQFGVRIEIQCQMIPICNTDTTGVIALVS